MASAKNSSGARKMQDSDDGTYYGLAADDPWVCSPLMEMAHGPAFLTQPALKGEVPTDETGLLPTALPHPSRRKEEY